MNVKSHLLNNFNLVISIFAHFLLHRLSHQFDSSTRRSIIIAVASREFAEVRQGCSASNERERAKDSKTRHEAWLESVRSAYPAIFAPVWSRKLIFLHEFIHEADRPDLGVSPFGRQPEVNRDTVPSDVPSGAFPSVPGMRRTLFLELSLPLPPRELLSLPLFLDESSCDYDC